MSPFRSAGWRTTKKGGFISAHLAYVAVVFVPLYPCCTLSDLNSALEAAGKWYGPTEAGPALPAAVTLLQFAGCMVLPAVVESMSHKGGGLAAMRAIPLCDWRLLRQ